MSEKMKNQIIEIREAKKNELLTIQEEIAFLTKKIDEEDIVELVAVFDETNVSTTKLDIKGSETLIKLGIGVVEEPIEVERHVRFVRTGSKVICTIYKDKKEVGKGVAECHMLDKFDYPTGVKIAELKARKDYFDRKLRNIIESQLEGNNNGI